MNRSREVASAASLPTSSASDHVSLLTTTSTLLKHFLSAANNNRSLRHPRARRPRSRARLIPPHAHTQVHTHTLTFSLPCDPAASWRGKEAFRIAVGIDHLRAGDNDLGYVGECRPGLAQVAPEDRASAGGEDVHRTREDRFSELDEIGSWLSAHRLKGVLELRWATTHVLQPGEARRCDERVSVPPQNSKAGRSHPE